MRQLKITKSITNRESASLDKYLQEIGREELITVEEEIFSHLFEAAEIARFTPQEIYEYEESLKIYRDWYSITKTAVDKAKREGREEGRAEGREEGRAEGREEGRAEGREEGREEVTLNVVKTMLDKGLDYKLISEVTGLSVDKIQQIDLGDTYIGA